MTEKYDRRPIAVFDSGVGGISVLAELMTLPGIGESRAGDIIAYRLEHGGFTDTKEIMQVPGIKESTYEKIKDLITVD